MVAGYLSFRVDWALILSASKQIDLHLYAVSTLLTIVSVFFLGAKYFLLIRCTPISHSVLSLVKINFISRFYALFLPSALGAEVVRWYKVTRNKTGRALFLASTLFERSVFILTLLLFGMVPLFFYTSNPEILILRSRLLPFLVLGMSLVCCFIAYFLFPTTKAFLNSIFGRTLGTLRNKQNFIFFQKHFSLNNPSPSLYSHIFGLSLLWQILFLGRLFILFNAANLHLSFVDVTWMGSLVLLLQVFPISFAGLGIREGAYAYFFSVFNLPPEKGVLVGVLFFTQELIFAGLGGLLELTEK